MARGIRSARRLTSELVEAVEWLPAAIVLGMFGAVALALTAIAVLEAVRVQAWWWLVSIVLLWPVGVIAWFVAGRGLYPGAADAQARPVTDGSMSDRTSAFLRSWVGGWMVVGGSIWLLFTDQTYIHGGTPVPDWLRIGSAIGAGLIGLRILYLQHKKSGS